MAINVYKFRDVVEMELVLRGGIIGTPVGKGIEGLVRLLLVPIAMNYFNLRSFSSEVNS